MIHEPLVFAALTDVAGKLRGKAFPVADLGGRLARGVGWTPTNVQITCFDVIAESPYGSFGDLLLVPDPDTEVCVDFEDGGPVERIMMGHVLGLDGTPWECCTRHALEQALAALERAAGVRLVAAFEHEFQLAAGTRPPGDAFSHAGFDAQAPFLTTLMAALREAGIAPECVMREYGADQYEVTVRPAPALAAADAAAILRTLTRETARRCGETATFTPLRDPAGVGNGVHVHLSLRDADGAPAAWDPDGPGGLSAVMGAFAAGVLRDLDALVALTAPSVISYARLTPHRWSAAFNNLGVQDREAAVRVCPVSTLGGGKPAEQFNLEFRAADAAASPHLALAAIVTAGVRGIEDGLATPAPVAEDLSLLDAPTLAARGFTRLPGSLEEALARFTANERVCGGLPGRLAEIYRRHKEAEIAQVAPLDETALYAAYEAVY